MSFQYDQYLTQHRSNVKRGFDWIAENLPELLVDGFDYGWQIEFAHDKSKDEQDEYEAYDAYFYGGNRSYAVMQNYQKAWLLHLHRNPHHWQYWILINDDPKEGEIILEMPYNYIIEMICDWCYNYGLIFNAVNENLPEIIDSFGSDTRKIFANEYIDDRNRLISSCREKSNMELWVENEVRIACEHERKASGTKEEEQDYGCACFESALKAYRSLLEDGHSGFSIGMTKYILVRMIERKPLTPIVDTEDVWIEVVIEEKLSIISVSA